MKWSRFWVVEINRSGTGKTAIYFDSKKEADKFAKNDNTTKPARVPARTNDGMYAECIYKTAEAAEGKTEDYYYTYEI